MAVSAVEADMDGAKAAEVNAIARFTPSLLPGEQLQQLFVAREPTLNRIMSRVHEAQHSSRRSHTLLVGPRGAGKTHVVSLVAHRIRQLIGTGAGLQLAWLPEDPWRVSSYERLLRVVLAALDDIPAEKSHAPVQRKDAPASRDVLEREIVARSGDGGVIVVIAENLDLLLSQIGEIGQQRLRHLLQTHRPLLLVATTTSVDADLALQSAPLYGFFVTERLQPFTVEQAQDMLQRIADVAGDHELAAALKSPQAAARLRAVEHLAGGQPRLWALLASGLTIAQLDELVTALVTRFDDLTPYYQEKLAHLSRQQRLIVAELADADRPLYVAQLAGGLDAEQRSVAKSVNDLVEWGWLVECTSPAATLLDRRRTYYELAEPLVRLAFQLKESRGKPVRLVVDFLKSWFDPASLSSASGFARAYAEAAIDAVGNDAVYQLAGTLSGARLATTRLVDGRVEVTKFAGDVDDALARLAAGFPDDYLMLPAAIRTVFDRLLDVHRLPESVSRARLDVHAAAAAEFGTAGVAPHPETNAWVRRAEELARSGFPALHIEINTQLIDWYSKAWRLDEARAVWEMMHTEINPEAATRVANMLGDAYRAAGHVDEAVAFLEKTTVYAERVLGPDHARSAESRSKLAYAYEAAGRFDETVTLIERTLESNLRLHGPSHADTLDSRNNLACAHATAGRLGEARTLLEETLTDCVRVLGPSHPDTLTVRGNLADIYARSGRFAEAIPLLEQSLADSERVLGVKHLDTVSSRNFLARAYAAAGRLGEAIQLLEQTVTDRERLLGVDHPSTLTSRHNLAYVYSAAGRFGEATQLFERTVADSERVLGPDHPDTQASREALELAFRLAGDEPRTRDHPEKAR